jgi:hypothetical protein
MNHQLSLLLDLVFLVLRHSTIARLSNDWSPYFCIIILRDADSLYRYLQAGRFSLFVMLYKSLKMRICPNFPDPLV